MTSSGHLCAVSGAMAPHRATNRFGADWNEESPDNLCQEVER